MGGWATICQICIWQGITNKLWICGQTLSTFMMSIFLSSNGFMDMNTAHPSLFVRQIHIQARMQNTRNKCMQKTKQSREGYPIHVKLAYGLHNISKCFLFWTPSMQCLAERDTSTSPLYNCSIHWDKEYFSTRAKHVFRQYFEY